MIEAEVNTITESLNNLLDLEKRLEYFGQDSKAIIQQMMKRRYELQQMIRSEKENLSSNPKIMDNTNNFPSKKNDLRSLISYGNNGIIIDRIRDALDPITSWKNLSTPIMHEGISKSPEIPGTHGEIMTTGLYSGGCAYSGTLADDGLQEPYNPKFWIHNWQGLIAFPPAPETVKLSYRFTVSAELHLYLAPVITGTIMSFVTLGTTNDISKDIVNWTPIGWPINTTLPLSTGLNFFGEIPISGNILLEKGQTAGVGIIFGSIISAADGFIQIIWGNFGTHLTLHPGIPLGASAYGLIQYRFDRLEVINSLHKIFEKNLVP